jgi:hypothetical protein
MTSLREYFFKMNYQIIESWKKFWNFAISITFPFQKLKNHLRLKKNLIHFIYYGFSNELNRVFLIVKILILKMKIADTKKGLEIFSNCHLKKIKKNFPLI